MERKTARDMGTGRIKRYSKYRQKRLTIKWQSQYLFMLIHSFQHYWTKITGAKRDYIYRKPCMYHVKS
jgi:hypothetical protein